MKKLPVDAKVEVDGTTYDINEVYPDLRVDPVHIREQLTEQAALYAYWSTLAEDAAILHDVAKRRVDYVESEIDAELRNEARAVGEKLTEAIVQRRIVLDERYQDKLDEMITARRAAALLSIIRRSLEQRLSALIALNNRDRSEMSAGMGGGD